MNTEFFTKDSHYLITPKRVFRNGEIVAEGTIRIEHLILNEPAWIVVDKAADFGPTYLKTDIVTAVLPNQEVFQGVKRSRKVYHVSFLAFIQDQWVKCDQIISAFNELHVRQIVKAKHGKEVRSITATSPALSSLTIPTLV